MNNIIFYTLLYNIKSKFSLDKYLEWGNNILESLKKYKLLVFTDEKTYVLLNKIKDKYNNIEFIIKELSEFQYFTYMNIFEKNTSKLYFPYHDISGELILIWVNRHIFGRELKDRYNFEYLCYLDWGYFRDGIYDINIDIDRFDKNKIYIGLIKNDRNYFNKILLKLTTFNKKNVEKLLINNIYSIGGGATLISRNMIDKWIDMYETSFLKFINENIDFKDDQMIILKTFNDNKHDFILLHNYSRENWFPFVYFFIKKSCENNEIKQIHYY